MEPFPKVGYPSRHITTFYLLRRQPRGHFIAFCPLIKQPRGHLHVLSTERKGQCITFFSWRMNLPHVMTFPLHSCSDSALSRALYCISSSETGSLEGALQSSVLWKVTLMWFYYSRQSRWHLITFSQGTVPKRTHYYIHLPESNPWGYFTVHWKGDLLCYVWWKIKFCHILSSERAPYIMF